MYSCVLHQWNSYERMCPTCWPSGITSDSTELIIKPFPTGDRDCVELKERISELEEGLREFLDWLNRNRPTMAGLGAPISLLKQLLNKHP